MGGELHALQLTTASPTEGARGGFHDLMSDANTRIADIVNSNDVVLFMKGTPLFPQCGFSSRAVAILDHLGVAYESVDVLQDRKSARASRLFRLADHPAALRQGRIRRRQRHHDGNVRGRRTAAAGLAR
jgi:hypothetical protein